MPTVLIADDEPNIRRMVGALLGAEGYEVIETVNGPDAVAKVREGEPDAALLDLMMPGETDGIVALEKLREIAPDLPVIMMSGRAGLADAVKATKLGAFNFLEKPLTPEGVLLAVASAIELRQARRTTRALREEMGLAGQMVGDSDVMKDVRRLIARVAPTDARVMITGESGTGKELVASAIHEGSERRDKPFIRVNCAAIPRDLVESEMFGHERGAFTGATQTRVGRFELAHKGTLFLDEVGDLGAEAQAKLLRAIEAQEIQRVGGNKVIKTDVRIVSATNHDLLASVKSGAFREDLYFRLNVIPLALPALRERPTDIVPLVHHFSTQFFKRTGRPIPLWRDDALSMLREYPWPGNVRELANVVERLAILHPGTEISSRELDEVLPRDGGVPRAARTVVSELPPEDGRPLVDAIDSYERNVIRRALSDAKGNIAEAARRLQTDRPNLYRRMRRLGIDASGVQ
ncbi:MAG: sigma-54-dependent Fis family transcriptional regulator [Gemmatimonadaceae bacterium]|nr:sigma-54-dependent Fis family transcriptional regulator [Gemmatimonadaceae bacterium]